MSQLKQQLGAFVREFARPSDIEAPSTVHKFDEAGLARTSFLRGQFLPNPNNPFSQAFAHFELSSDRSQIEALQTRVKDDLDIQLDYRSESFESDPSRRIVQEIIILHRGEIGDILAAA